MWCKMSLNNKATIALIIALFVFGVFVGYIYTKHITPVPPPPLTPTPTISYTPTPTQTVSMPSPTITPTLTSPPSTPTVTPAKIKENFTVKQLYDPEKDIPTATIELANYRANPATVRIHPGESVLITFVGGENIEQLSVTLDTSFERKLRPKGVIYVIFHNKGSYSLKAVIPSDVPNIIPRPYAEATIKVY